MKKYLIAFTLFISVTVLTASCVNHAYDFEKVDPDITLFGEDVAIPLGQSGPLTIEALLGEKMEDFLIPLDDNTCAIQYKAKAVNIALNELKNIDGAAPFQRFCDYPINYDFDLFTKPANPAFNSQNEADLSNSIPGKVNLESKTQNLDFSLSNLPSQLASLKSVTLGSKSRIEVTVSVPDCVMTAGTVVPNLSLSLGSFLVSNDFPDGVIKVNPTLDSKNGYSAKTTIRLNKLVLDPKSFNASEHTLAVNASMTFNGACTINQPRTTRDRHAKAPDDAKLRITIVMKDLAIQDIEGSFDYSAKNQVSFQLGDLSASMTDKLKEEIRLDFSDPTILLDIESNITIPINAKLDLAARQNKVKYAEVKNIPISLPGATPGSFISKRYRLAAKPPHNQGEEAVAVNFASLLSRIPDDMLITTNVATRSDKTAILRIGENYRVTITPHIIIPLSFGPNLKVTLRDTLALPAKMGEMIQKNTFQVKGTIDNSFPLQFTFSIVMVDKDGVALTDTVSQTLAADSVNDVDLILTKLPEADPTQITSAFLTFEVDGIPDGRPVMTDDGILTNLHIVIPGGLHLTL